MGLFDKINLPDKETRQANRSTRKDNRQDTWDGITDAIGRGKDSANKVAGKVGDKGAEIGGKAINKFNAPTEFMPYYKELLCFRRAVNNYYIAKGTDVPKSGETYSRDAIHDQDATTVFMMYTEWSKQALAKCQAEIEVKRKSGQGDGGGGAGLVVQTEGTPIIVKGDSPFDRRLDRLFTDAKEEPVLKVPYGVQYSSTSTVGLVASEKLIEESGEETAKKDELKKKLKAERQSLKGEDYYIGVPALINTYALTKLYGSAGGQQLLNIRGERRWYEVDQAWGTGSTTSVLNYASVPTTSSLISWGNADPYGRMPYHFTDFVFAKYWNKIENNRLITLRRYAAPILDNLKFPGMGGDNTADKGSSGKIVFPPMATAITYFGADTGNDIGSLLKFTSGLKWDDAKSDVWKVDTESTPELEEGPGGMNMFGRLAGLSKMLNVAGGDFNSELIMNKGALPPDPYNDGPYENRILGPVNRIDAVKKRAPGLEFEWSGLNLVFEYVARPIGGINTKAVLLDILSNFLVMGSASAIFFGGQHRFMGNPAKYPFLGGEKGIEAWYRGDPIGWANNTINAMAGEVSNPEGGLQKGAKSFWSDLFGGGGEGGIKGIFGAVKGLFSEGGIGGNVLKHEMAAKSAGTVPYLSGLKALLTGEPVGEWHVTIGNPLNPIAMIGNLICTGVEVEFGNEIGPDDFPTEIKVTVKMDHGMARDRDAIQSVFNRGMGRIYDLPDEYESSADGQTVVDRYTANANETGTAALSRGWLAGPSTTGSVSGAPIIKEPANQGNTSVWANTPFRVVSPNEDLSNFYGDMARSQYRSVDWVALKSLK